MNNLTLIDNNGNRIECECKYVERFMNVPGGAKEVVLRFEDSKTAKEVFDFVWVKAMGRQITWGKKNKEEASRPTEVSPSPRS